MKKTVKIIFHIDLNTFFCTVAAILNPALKGKAFAIGRENSYKGVLSTASYEARKYGIHAGMSLIDAYKLKRDLIVTSVDYSYYEYYHEKFVNLLKEYSDIIEVASIDEAYVDVSEICQTRHPLEVAKEIQDRLVKEYSLPCSIGIAPTLFLAKMGSDLKKPLGISVVRKREVEQVLFPLSVKEIFGIGKKTYPILIDNGISTIADFIYNKDKTISLVGERTYNYVYDAMYGNTTNVVDENRYSTRQSISTSQTYDYPIQTETDVLFELRAMTKKLVVKLKEEGYYTKTIRVIFRNTNFKTYSKSISTDYTDNLEDIYFIVEQIVDESYNGEALRLVGVELAGLTEELPEEYNLFTFENILEKEKALNQVLDELNEKYGESFIHKGVKNQ